MKENLKNSVMGVYNIYRNLMSVSFQILSEKFTVHCISSPKITVFFSIILKSTPGICYLFWGNVYREKLVHDVQTHTVGYITFKQVIL
jgi:hypothetical protein